MAALLPNSCFIHIPRTGGSYIREVLKNLDLFQGETGSKKDRPFQYRAHMRYDKVKHECGDRKLFTFVREPHSWFTSLWETRQDTGHWPLLDETDKSMFYMSISAQSWITNLLKWRPDFQREILIPYGVHQPDVLIGHTETLDADLKSILHQLEGIS